MSAVLILIALLVSHLVLVPPVSAAAVVLRWQPYDQPGFAATRRRQFEAAELALTNRLQQLLAGEKASDKLILTYIQRLVNVCVCQAKFDQACNYAELAVRYAEKQNMDDLHLALLHGLLGKLRCKQSLLSQSEMEYETAAALLAHLPPAAAAQAAAQINFGLAEVFTKQQRYAQAAKIYSRALEQPESSAGPLKFTHAAVSPPELLAFAECLVGLGQLDEAAARIRQALAIDTEELGVGQPALAAELNDLSCVLAKQLKFAEAEKQMAAAVKICRAYRYADLPDWIENLASLLAAQGKSAEASALRKEVLALHSGGARIKVSLH